MSQKRDMGHPDFRCGLREFSRVRGNRKILHFGRCGDLRSGRQFVRFLSTAIGEQSLAVGVGVFLIALENIGLRYDAFEQA